jgi:hypothetical protein
MHTTKLVSGEAHDVRAKSTVDSAKSRPSDETERRECSVNREVKHGGDDGTLLVLPADRGEAEG